MMKLREVSRHAKRWENKTSVNILIRQRNFAFKTLRNRSKTKQFAANKPSKTLKMFLEISSSLPESKSNYQDYVFLNY